MVIAEREHEQAARLIETAVGRVDDSAWHRPRPGRSWTPSDEFAHVLLAYDFGVRAANGTMAMRRERSAWVSALSRAILIPLLLRRGSFPAGGISPEELDPLRNRAFANHVVDRDAARRTLRDLAEQTRVAFVRAATEAPERRIVHAYFGGLTLESGWRLLSAHTRHHAALLGG